MSISPDGCVSSRWEGGCCCGDGEKCQRCLLHCWVHHLTSQAETVTTHKICNILHSPQWWTCSRYETGDWFLMPRCRVCFLPSSFIIISLSSYTWQRLSAESACVSSFPVFHCIGEYISLDLFHDGYIKLKCVMSQHHINTYTSSTLSITKIQVKSG